MDLNTYRIMWIFVLFDLPTETMEEKKDYVEFRKKLVKDGFQMFQFSIYAQFCGSRENTEVHVKWVKQWMPPLGHIGILTITDKQFSMMEIFSGKKKAAGPPPTQQLMLF